MTTKLLTLAQAAASRLSWQVGDHPHSVTASVDGDTTATVYEDGPRYRAEIELGLAFWAGEGETVADAFSQAQNRLKADTAAMRAAITVLTGRA